MGLCITHPQTWVLSSDDLPNFGLLAFIVVCLFEFPKIKKNFSACSWDMMDMGIAYANHQTILKRIWRFHGIAIKREPIPIVLFSRKRILVCKMIARLQVSSKKILVV